jgi:hypothetical protein
MIPHDSSTIDTIWHVRAVFDLSAFVQKRVRPQARTSTRNRTTGQRSASNSAAEKIDRARAFDLIAFVHKRVRPQEILRQDKRTHPTPPLRRSIEQEIGTENAR